MSQDRRRTGSMFPAHHRNPWWMCGLSSLIPVRSGLEGIGVITAAIGPGGEGIGIADPIRERNGILDAGITTVPGDGAGDRDIGDNLYLF